MSWDVLIADLEQIIELAKNRARDRDTVTASHSPTTKFDDLDSIIVKMINVPQLFRCWKDLYGTVRERSIVSFSQYTNKTLGHLKRIDRMYEEMRAGINKMKETTAVQDLSLQDWAFTSESGIPSSRFYCFSEIDFSVRLGLSFIALTRSGAEAVLWQWYKSIMGLSLSFVVCLEGVRSSSRLKSESEGDFFSPGFAMTSIRPNDWQLIEHNRPQKPDFNLVLSSLGHI